MFIQVYDRNGQVMMTQPAMLQKEGLPQDCLIRVNRGNVYSRDEFFTVIDPARTIELRSTIIRKRG